MKEGKTMKPILFNTEMTRAITDGVKTVTRRVCKITVNDGENVNHSRCHTIDFPKRDMDGICAQFYNRSQFNEVKYYCGRSKPPYIPGDILYVRETWAPWSRTEGTVPEIHYRSDGEMLKGVKWRPSIHMPREAARFFLRVKAVRVERLQDITDSQALLEGVPEDSDYPLDNPIYCPVCKGEGLIGKFHPVSLGYMEVDCPHCDTPRKRFSNLWGSTIKLADRALYGWDANPWVWVIEFERCEKPKED